jgi:protein-disulfide isomerase
MLTRAPITALAVLFSLIASGFVFAEQDKQKPEAQQPSPAIKQQLDELKENQQRMLNELAEIKKLLQEKSAKAEYAAKPALPTVISVNVHGEPFRGDSRARLAIMEYSDFECSFCAKYVREIYPRVDADYIKPGKIKYFFRDLPEPGQTNAMLKARAARCAGEQGKFWEMHDLLFAAQPALAGTELASCAQTLGLDTAKFNECLASERYQENIRLSMAGAKKIGIYGTPAFLIGTVTEDGDFLRATKVLVGGESYEVLKSALEELLAPQPKK